MGEHNTLLILRQNELEFNLDQVLKLSFLEQVVKTDMKVILRFPI